MSEEFALVHFDRARAELAKAVRIDEVKRIRDKAEAVRAYIRQQQGSVEMQNHAAEIKVRAERRAGELLGATVTPGNPQLSHDTTIGPTLPELGITRDQSSTWQQIAAIPEEQFERHVAERKAEGDQLTTAGVLRIGQKPHVAHSTGDNEWYTPPQYIEAARAVMGDIDCDPATSNAANRMIKAKKSYTMDDDGLAQTWDKRVWLNPPYAQPLVAQFAEAITSKYESGEINEACVLVNNATETAWFQRMLCRVSAICVLRGRVKFIDECGEPTGAPLQGQVVLYFGSGRERFAEVFGTHGCVLVHAE